MSYTYDPTTTLGRVRMLMYDTDSSALMFSDEEINAMLTLQSSDPFLTAATLINSFAVKMARNAKKKSAGKYSEDLTRVAAELREQAKALIEMAQEPWDAVIQQTFENVQDLSRRMEDDRARDFIVREYIRGNFG